MNQKTKKQSIPNFRTREELAKFWDTHNVTDYLDELKPIKVDVSPGLSSGVTVRFNHQDLTNLKQKAHQKGIGVTTLIRMIALDFLQNTHPNRPSVA